jgi:hypothetical protein
MVSNLEMEIGRLGLNGAAQKIVYAQCHVFAYLRLENRITERSITG